MWLAVWTDCLVAGLYAVVSVCFGDCCAVGVGLWCSVLVCGWFCESFCWLPSRRGVLWILFCVLFDVCWVDFVVVLRILVLVSLQGCLGVLLLTWFGLGALVDFGRCIKLCIQLVWCFLLIVGFLGCWLLFRFSEGLLLRFTDAVLYGFWFRLIVVLLVTIWFVELLQFGWFVAVVVCCGFVWGVWSFRLIWDCLSCLVASVWGVLIWYLLVL